MFFKSICTCICLSLVSLSTNAAGLPPSLTTLGLYDDEHTRADGYRFNDFTQLNSANQVIGQAERYNLTSNPLGTSAWLYNGIDNLNIGLTDTGDFGHTNNTGVRNSTATQLNQAGQVIGSSLRYEDTSGGDLGESAWLYNGTTTLKIGLADDATATTSGHSDSTGYQINEANQLNKAGHVLGNALRFDFDDFDVGNSVWIYDGSTTKNIGLVGATYTADDDYKYSEAIELNEAGQVAGNSDRFDGFDPGGSTAWLYNGSSTQIIGLYNAEHTSSGSYQSSFSNQLNEAGQVTGVAERYDSGSTNLGNSAWLYNGTSTQKIGLTDAEHTQTGGYKNSTTDKINEAGQVLGTSERYNSGTPNLGESAWVYNGSTTVNVGLTDAEHTGTGGLKNSLGSELNEAGESAGTSERFDVTTGTSRGFSAWKNDGSSPSQKIGLIDGSHTQTGGYKSSSITKMNENGVVIGSSDRFDGVSSEGLSAWVFDGSSTTNVGLTGTEHTRIDGFQNNTAIELNEAGQVGGNADRFNGTATDFGSSAWFYDPVTGMTHFNNLSVQNTGYAYSEALFLSETGLMLGTYDLFGGTEDAVLLGKFAFAFRLDVGFFDLGLRFNPNLGAFDWSSLASAIHSGGSNSIIGYGLLDDMTIGQAVYLAENTVPVPAAAWLFGSGLIGLVGFARRGKR